MHLMSKQHKLHTEQIQMSISIGWHQLAEYVFWVVNTASKDVGI